MSIFKRMRDISMATMHDLMDKAEDPVQMLKQYLRDMEGDITDAENAVARQMVIEKKCKHQLEQSLEMVDKRNKQAMSALESNNEDLARRTLQDNKQHQLMADVYKGQYDNAKSNADSLRQQLQEMKVEFENMKHSKDELIARAETAKARKNMNQAMSGFGKDLGARGFERMNEKVLQLEAEAEAGQLLKGFNRTLDDELDALDALMGKDDVENELAALKEQLAQRKKSE